jgi:hypothetical protein
MADEKSRKPGHFLACLRIQLMKVDLAPAPFAREGGAV